MRSVVLAPGAGRFIAVGSAGAGVVVKACPEETGGLCPVWEGRVPPGTVGAGPHYHRGRDEFFYVLQGELVLRVGDERQTAPAGTFAFIPRGTIHGFLNASRDDAALLVMHHPGGFRTVPRGDARTDTAERQQRRAGCSGGSFRHDSCARVIELDLVGSGRSRSREAASTLTCCQHASMLFTCPRWSKSAMCRTRCTESSRAGLQTQDKRSPISCWPSLSVWPPDRRATKCWPEFTVESA